MKIVEVAFETPADPISMNKGDDWKVRKAAAEWRDRAYFAWCEAHPGVGPAGRSFGHRAKVTTVLSFPEHRRRDPINFAKTVKHIVDGFTMAGAWPDDTLEYVDQQIPRLKVNDTNLVLVRVEAIAPLEES